MSFLTRVFPAGRTGLAALATSTALVFGTLVSGSGLAAQEMQGPTLRAGLNLEISTLDPARATNTSETYATMNMYDPLVYPDAEAGIVPWIAESWEMAEDNLSYTMQIRDDIPFHDGTLIDAEDVAFSMRRAAEMPSMVSNFLRNVDYENIEVLDSHTVRFNLKDIDPAFLRALTWLRIVNKDLVMENVADGPYGDFGDYGSTFLQTNSAGSGPYILTNFSSSIGVDLVAFDGYTLKEWHPDAPAALKLEIIPEVVTIQTKVMAGEFDLDLQTPAPSRLEAYERTGNFSFGRWQTLNTYYMTMNTSRPPLDDVNIRKAISHAYDRETVMNRIFSGGVPLEGPVPRILMGSCDGLTAYEYDVEKAREYVAASKYSAEELAAMPMEIAAVAGSNAFQQVALMFSLGLKQIGITAEVTPVRWTDITAAQTERNSAYPFVFFFDSARVQHASALMNYFTEHGWGLPYPTGGLYWNDPEVSELIEAAAVAPDGSDEQNDLYCQASIKIVDEAPAVFSHNANYIMPSWNYLTASTAEPTGSTYYAFRFEDYRFDQEDSAYRRNHGL